ncbi:MAG: YggS family pyridoxal phosphate-dependent enzyme [Phycisphaeraceae bacterium]|nr:YggS family pyridoxal phosphate-dependent enzyme [Phycisphaeraceae bacterium]
MATKESVMSGSEAETLESRYQSVKRRIAEAAKRAGRDASEIMLVAVTKFAEADQVRSLIQMGHRDFGENKVQNLLHRVGMVEEFMARRRVLPRSRQAHDGDSLLPAVEDAVRWHMIGHLQRNKAKKAIEFCRLIHSVDSLRLAEEIQAIAMKREHPVEVLVQVNCSGEASKFGCPLPAAVHLAEQIDTMVSVRVRGLMTMAPLSENPEDARETFARCRELFEEVKKTGVGDGKFNILSMGMSGDFEVAISEGSNVVRVGSAIFGEPKAVEEGGEEEE